MGGKPARHRAEMILKRDSSGRNYNALAEIYTDGAP
jgi:hypothetical protein